MHVLGEAYLQKICTKLISLFQDAVCNFRLHKSSNFLNVCLYLSIPYI